MFKKCLLACGLILAMSAAFADVDVNKADQAALDGVRGIGPTTSRAILDERKKGGEFKDWSDFSARVKGIGDARATKLSQAGLTVNGKSNASRSKATGEKAGKAVAAAAVMKK